MKKRRPMRSAFFSASGMSYPAVRSGIPSPEPGLTGSTSYNIPPKQKPGQKKLSEL